MFEKAAVPKTRAHKVYRSLGGSDKKTCENPDVNFPQQLAEGAGAGRTQAFLLTRLEHPKLISTSQGLWGAGSPRLQGTKGKGTKDVQNNKQCPCCRGVQSLSTHTSHKARLGSRVWTRDGGLPPWKRLQK